MVVGTRACNGPSMSVRFHYRPTGSTRRARRDSNPNLLIRSQMLYPLSYGRSGHEGLGKRKDPPLATQSAAGTLCVTSG